MGNMVKYIGRVAFLLILVGLMVFWLSREREPAAPPEKPITSDPFFQEPGLGQTLYRNLLFKFSLLYPEDLEVSEHHQGSETIIVFTDARKEKGFQIFVIPYAEKQIREERFKMDVPSGIVSERMDIQIDGVPATAFLSKDPILGETREVWLLYNGLLYEVTTFKELDAWLSSIMTTWRFLRM